jgi:serine/threonine protein kinase
MPLTVGTRLGPYEVIELIGAGGMGEVYRARDKRLDRDVAIKTLPAAFSGNVERLRRVENEARAARPLSPQRILNINAIGSAIGHHCLLGELLDDEFSMVVRPAEDERSPVPVHIVDKWLLELTRRVPARP